MRGETLGVRTKIDCGLARANTLKTTVMFANPCAVVNGYWKLSARPRRQDRKVITEEISVRVAQDGAYQNAQRQNAKLEHDKALNRVFFICLSLSERPLSQVTLDRKSRGRSGRLHRCKNTGV